MPTHDPARAAQASFDVVGAPGPFVAVAVHGAHAVRPEVAALLHVTDGDRRYEEDPYTDEWVDLGDVGMVARRSRFEVDLNRPRHEAVYGEAVWDLRVWRERSPDMVARSLEDYDTFYAALDRMLTEVAERFGGFVVLDLHSYNHRRDGAQSPPAPQSATPDVNVGTAGIDERWQPLVDGFIAAVAAGSGAPPLDVRADVRFEGGYLPRWVNARFAERGFAMAIEVKKIYMDEHTGERFPETEQLIRGALARGARSVLPRLERV